MVKRNLLAVVLGCIFTAVVVLATAGKAQAIQQTFQLKEVVVSLEVPDSCRSWKPVVASVTVEIDPSNTSAMAGTAGLYYEVTLKEKDRGRDDTIATLTFAFYMDGNLRKTKQIQFIPKDYEMGFRGNVGLELYIIVKKKLANNLIWRTILNTKNNYIKLKCHK